jgi:hypothetical protein
MKNVHGRGFLFHLLGIQSMTNHFKFISDDERGYKRAPNGFSIQLSRMPRVRGHTREETDRQRKEIEQSE